MKLMACTLGSSYTLTEVELHNTPRVLDKRTIAHLSVPNSKLIDYTTVVYYDETCDMMESDDVYYCGERVGMLYYSGGWNFINEKGITNKLVNLQHIKVEIRTGNRNRKSLQSVVSMETRQAPKFCIDDNEYDLTAIMYNNEQGITIAGIAAPVLPRSLMLSTGLRLKAKSESFKVYSFGSLYDGGIVSMSEEHVLCITDVDGKLIREIEEDN